MEKIAAITMFRGDIEWLQLWLDHYENLLGGRQGLYVILHGDDNKAREISFGTSQIIVPFFSNNNKFENKRIRFIHSLVLGLQRYYRCVIFTDTDELLCLHPDAGANLPDYLAEHEYTGKVLSCVGLELIATQADNEDLDLKQPILQQRFRGVLNSGYCKPNMFFRPFGRANQHRIPGEPWVIDRNILLFHLRYADQNRFLKVARERAQYAEDMSRDDGSVNVGGWLNPIVGYNHKRSFFLEQNPESFTKENYNLGLEKFERRYRRRGNPGAKLYGHFVVPESMRHLA